LVGSRATGASHRSPPNNASVVGARLAKIRKFTIVKQSLTLRCKLVGVFAMICAVLLQNQAQDSVVLWH